MVNKASICGVLTATLLLAGSFCSAAPSNGVLPDGRAYRTDNNGNQVVDYIAELESQVDVLTKQVYTLEDQVSARGCPERAAPVAACPVCEQRACPEDVVSKEIVKNVPDQGCLHELQSLKAVAANQKLDFDVEAAKLRKELATHLSQQDSSASATQACAKENEELKLEIANQRDSSVEQDTQLIALKKEREELSTQLAKLRTDYNETRAALESAELKVASQSHDGDRPKPNSVSELAALPISAQSDSRATVSSAALANNGASVGTLSGARLRAIDSLKGSLSSDLNRTQSLLATRDKLFAQNRGRSAGVTLEPAAAVSSNGRNLAALRQALANASSGRELSEIKSEVLEIQRKINDDLSAANRVKRLG